ncbi:hypothetical protein PsYK624_094520 [Phanerochaete sordida]|uniref:Uncharacterized protein n=1 Tax=Phanerochaete sordida TaxID=48140 RepID=A0A9P3GE90_9APHY|nr:hypothetical protein PsYK624_094520 [Phanerochaete sordida]
MILRVHRRRCTALQTQSLYVKQKLGRMCSQKSFAALLVFGGYEDKLTAPGRPGILVRRFPAYYLFGSSKAER